MNAFLTLLKREWLEAKTPFLWFPVAALAVLVSVSLLALLIWGFGEVNVYIQSEGDASSSFLFINQWSEQDWLLRMTSFRSMVAAPFYLIYLAAAVFMLLGALYDERRDHSVLFWKSLPVSDLTTVLSKLVIAAWIAPAVMIVCVVTAQVFLLGLFSLDLSGSELGDPGLLWQHAGLIGGAVQLVLGFLIQGLWVLPIAGYLLLVSVAVPRQPLLWALVIPIPIAIVEYVVLRTRMLADFIARHAEPAALPNFTGDDDRIMPVVHTAGDQLALLLDPDLWLGLLIGAVLLYAAARLRAFKNEL
jgi:ABC-2 type transport system permease protein